MKLTEPKNFHHWMRIMAVVAGLTAVCFAAGPIAAMPIDRVLNVNVIQVCDNFGKNCASTGPLSDPFYEKEVDKIWSQAGIDVHFVLGKQLWSTPFSYINDNVFKTSFFNLEMQYGNPSTVDMWLVHTIAGAYGEAWLGAGDSVIAMDTVMRFNAPFGRIDTIAHELGHNLGLGHDNSNPSFLMATNRYVPSSLGNIFPDGADYDFLSQNQINRVRRSSLLRPLYFLRDECNDGVDGCAAVPESSTCALLIISLIALFMLRRRFAVQ